MNHGVTVISANVPAGRRNFPATSRDRSARHVPAPGRPDPPSPRPSSSVPAWIHATLASGPRGTPCPGVQWLQPADLAPISRHRHSPGMEREFEGETVDSRRSGLVEPEGPGGHLYLLVLEGNTSAVHPLPRSGSLLVGRSSEAGIPIRDPSVSRQHAKVVLENGEAQVVDL